LPELEDLQHGRNKTVGSLLISLAVAERLPCNSLSEKRIASIRLTAAGLDIPEVSLVSDPELALYEYLQSDRR
jgi:hypothetical protein